jgi:hypothetical protein
MPKHPHYPQVELPESEFQQMLDLVDALDPQQLMRLYCKVGRKIGPHIETIPGAPGEVGVDPNYDTGSYMPPALEAPSDPPGGGGSVDYVDFGDIEIE